jgi:uncharacterized protein (DUF58 family)
MKQETPTLSSEMMKQVRHLQIKAKHLVNSSFAGEFKSAFRGRGMEFDEIREYSPGDDIRSIDWNVTARMDHPYVKIFRDERELSVLLILDASRSTLFGTKTKSKKTLMTEICALLAYVTLHSHDKCGLLIFTDQVELYLPPKKGRGHTWRIIQSILTFEPKSNRTNIQKAMEFTQRVLKKRSIIFFLSDFQDQYDMASFKQQAQKHDFISFVFQDPFEEELIKLPLIQLEDCETKTSLISSWNKQKDLQIYRLKRLQEQKDRIRFFRQHHIDFLTFSTHDPYLIPLIHFFHSRERKRIS